MNFSIYLVLPATLGPEIHSASNINDYQKHLKKIMILESKVRPVRWADKFTVIREPSV
jgi:hypothetical protein